jgi:molybdopterin/thiamine biosynthesis adenylyltransferase
VVLQQLAHLGLRRLLVIDPDVIETTNLNRVVGTTPDDVGRAKVDVAADMIRRIRPDATVEAIREDVRDSQTARRLLASDFFFACTDSQGSRAVLSQLAYQFLVPGIDMGVAIQARPSGGVSHISGRVQMLAPGLACLLCSHVLDPEAVRRDLLTDAARVADPYISGAVVPQPAVISINSAAASLAVTMFLSAVTGVPVASRAQRLRLESGVVSNVSTTPDPACPWCASSGALGRGDTWPMPGRGTAMGASR